MKTCPICSLTKDDSFFGKKKTKNGQHRLQAYCKACDRIRARRNYHKKREQYSKVARESLYRRRNRNRKLMEEFLRDKFCVDCGISKSYLLEFDHITGKKRKEVAKMVSSGYSWETIMTEIKKCEMRCANCHRERHYLERNYLLSHNSGSSKS